MCAVTNLLHLPAVIAKPLKVHQTYLGIIISFTVIHGAFLVTDFHKNQISCWEVVKYATKLVWEVVRLIKGPTGAKVHLFVKPSNHLSDIFILKMQSAEEAMWRAKWRIPFVLKYHYFKLMIMKEVCMQYNTGNALSQYKAFIIIFGRQSVPMLPPSCLSQTRGRRFIITRCRACNIISTSCQRN